MQRHLLTRHPRLVQALWLFVSILLINTILVGFSWEVTDIEGDTLTCTLVYDDGEEEKIDNCGEVTNTFYTFYEPGGYTVMLHIDDGLNSVVSSVAVRVLEAEVEEGTK